jgi:glycosyltransferase involved in cell wall biosynthesis
MQTILSINATAEIHGGADRFFHALNALLVSQGESVVTLTARPRNALPSEGPAIRRYYFESSFHNTGPVAAVRNAAHIFKNAGFSRTLADVIASEKPAIAHIHNIYHRIPYDLVKVMKSHDVRIVWWLHDYKWICPNHQLFTSDEVCTRCKDGRYGHAVRYRCQNGSLMQSLIIAAFSRFIRWRGYAAFVDAFIAPSQACARLFADFGFHPLKIRVMPHFNYLPQSITAPERPADLPDRYALYAGRIERNKGILPMIEAFGSLKYPLIIAGKGNLEDAARRICAEKGYASIRFIGHQTTNALNAWYAHCAFSVVPSLWHEIFGLSVLESYAHGKPVVASRMGALPETVEDGKSGLLCAAGDVADLIDKCRRLIDSPAAAKNMGYHGRALLASRFSAESYWERLHNELML